MVSADAAVLVCVVDSAEPAAVSVVVVTVPVTVVVVVVSSGSRFRYTFRDTTSSPLAVLNPFRQVPDVISFSSGIPRTMQPFSVRLSVLISKRPDDNFSLFALIYSSALYPAGMLSIHRR